MFIVLASSTCLLAGCTSKPDGVTTQVMDRFDGLDFDRDGRLSRDEFSSSWIAQETKYPDEAFEKADANRDGYISADEVEALLKARRNDMEKVK